MSDVRYEFPRPLTPATEQGPAPLSREWLRYLEALARRVAELEARVTTLETPPDEGDGG